LQKKFVQEEFFNNELLNIEYHKVYTVSQLYKNKIILKI